MFRALPVTVLNFPVHTNPTSPQVSPHKEFDVQLFESLKVHTEVHWIPTNLLGRLSSSCHTLDHKTFILFLKSSLICSSDTPFPFLIRYPCARNFMFVTNSLVLVVRVLFVTFVYTLVLSCFFGCGCVSSLILVVQPYISFCIHHLSK